MRIDELRDILKQRRLGTETAGERKRDADMGDAGIDMRLDRAIQLMQPFCEVLEIARQHGGILVAGGEEHRRQYAVYEIDRLRVRVRRGAEERLDLGIGERQEI